MIYENSSNIELYIEVIYKNRVAFMVSIYIQVKYRSIIQITSQNEEAFFKFLDNLLCKYNSSGFTIAVIHADN